MYVVFKVNTPNKMNHTMRKSMKNCARKLFQKLCTFLFEVTSAFGKMCRVFFMRLRAHPPPEAVKHGHRECVNLDAKKL